jgi:hypothetical protein
MAQATILGGSANLVADLSVDTNFVLTGLDNNGKVLPTINVQVFDPLGDADLVYLQLPESSAMNYRNVTININRGKFGNTLAITPTGEDKICGLNQEVKLEVGKGATQQVQLLQGDNWTIGATLVIG